MLDNWFDKLVSSKDHFMACTNLVLASMLELTHSAL